MKLVRYDQFINEGSDSLLDIFKEALTYITDEWTDWKYDINKLGSYVYEAKFETKSDFDFGDVKELVIRLNSMKSHLGDDITNFVFDFHYGKNSLEFEIRVFFVKIKVGVSKGIKIDDIISINDEEIVFDRSSFQSLLRESGYDFNYESKKGNYIFFNLKLDEDLDVDSEAVEVCGKLDKVLDIFTVKKMSVGSDLEKKLADITKTDFFIDYRWESFNKGGDVYLRFKFDIRSYIDVNFI